MERVRSILLAAVGVVGIIGLLVGFARPSDPSGPRRNTQSKRSVLAESAESATQARARRLDTSVQRASDQHRLPPLSVAPAASAEPVPASAERAPRDEMQEQERQAWLAAEELRTSAMAARLGLNAEETKKFVALKRAHNEARAEVREILQEQPTLARPEDVEGVLATRLGTEAVLALRQRSHLTAVHALIGDERFIEYGALVDGNGDWEGTDTAVDTTEDTAVDTTEDTAADTAAEGSDPSN